LNFEVADILVNAGPVFLNGSRCSSRTTNGCFSKVVVNGCILKDSDPRGKMNRCAAA
jgi:hypothetical protein